MPLALSLFLSLAHEVPGCVYLAVAEREGADFVTADRRPGEIARSRGVPTTLLSTG
jgi:predicted nucleic acid-binding protein